MASTDIAVSADFAEVIVAYNEAADRLKRSHDLLCDEVARLRAELEQKNQMLQRRDRLAALGQMAAGMAHEIRNPLGGIQLFASLLERDLAGRDEQVELVRKIQAGSQRLNEIVSDMLAFTGMPDPECDRVAVRPLVENALDYAQPRTGSGTIEVSMDVRDGLVVWADAHMIERAILNLVLNAIEAMPRGGPLHVSASPGSDGLWTQIRIADAGDGMDRAVQDKMFDPFFTTKDHGTGLGLAIVHRIIEAHDGQISLTSEPGRGTTVVVSLPTGEGGIVGGNGEEIRRAGAA